MFSFNLNWILRATQGYHRSTKVYTLSLCNFYHTTAKTKQTSHSDISEIFNTARVNFTILLDAFCLCWAVSTKSKFRTSVCVLDIRGRGCGL
jgi:hypothetical protein